MIDRRRLLAGAAGLALAPLGACRDAPPPERFADLTYGHRGQFRLAVSTVEVVSEFAPALGPPHVENQMPVSAEETLARWGRDRLVAAGGVDRYARFIVLDASVTETELARTRGLRGSFTVDQAQRYDIVLRARLELRQQRGSYQAGSIEAAATRFITVPEDVSLAQRDHTLYELLEGAMIDLDAKLDELIRTHLAASLVG